MAELINLTPKWEYMSESPVSMDRMNELGAEGWEMIWYNAFFDQKEYEMKTMAIFKRVRYEQLEISEPPKESRSEFDARAAELIAKDGNKRLSDLGFPNRIMNALANVGIRELNDLLRISRKSLSKPKGMGPKSIKFIDEYYKFFGFHYGEEELLSDPSRKLYNGFMAYKLPPREVDVIKIKEL